MCIRDSLFCVEWDIKSQLSQSINDALPVEHCNLQKLDVSGNKFGLSGVERLLQIVDVCRLRSFNLSGTIGAGHAQQLLKQLAKLLLHCVSTTPQPFYGPFPGPPGWAGARKLLNFVVQGKINRRRHTEHPAGRHSIRTKQCQPTPSRIFTGRMPFLPPNQQCQSTEGN